MAKILLGDRIADIRGSIGGTTYSRNTFANYIRNKTSPVNPNTPAQQLVKNRFTAMSQSWTGLTEANRISWIDGAPTWSNNNIFNQSIDYTGFSLYGRLNRNRQEINEPLISTFVLPAEVDSFTSLSLVADTTGGTMEITFDPALAADHKVVIRATRPLSPGQNFVRTEFRKIAVLDSTNLSPVDLVAFYTAVFGVLPPVNAKIFVDAKQVLISNGQNSVPIKASAIVL